MSEGDAIELKVAELNNLIQVWTRKTTGDMNDLISRLNLVDSGDLFRKLGYKFKYDTGEIFKISWKAPRYGFVLANVGNSYKAKSAAGEFIKAKQISSNPRKYQKRKLYSNSEERDWIFHVIETKIDELADLVSNNYAERILERSKIIEGRKR